MDINLIVTYLVAMLFWALVLIQMGMATAAFCASNTEYDKGVEDIGTQGANATSWFCGFLAMWMPVLQGGLWLHGSEPWAWGFVLIILGVWIFLFLISNF